MFTSSNSVKNNSQYMGKKQIFVENYSKEKKRRRERTS